MNGGVEGNRLCPGPRPLYPRRLFSRQSRPWLRVLGPVGQQEKWDALEAATVVCLPSRHEAFGRIFLEAWSKGKPVIGGRIPAVADVIDDERNGLLVSPGSAAELSLALERLLKDPALATALGRRGRQALDERLHWPPGVGPGEAALEPARPRGEA